jgi:hypothetical protein
MLAITGAAGTGKTTLVRDLISTRMPPRIQGWAVHHCRAHVVASMDPVRILGSVAGQLARRLPGYRDMLGQLTPGLDRDNDGVSAVVDRASVRAAIEYAIFRPLDALASMDRLRGEVLVVLDGLDEGSPGSIVAINELLAICQNSPQPRLRMLLTMRPDDVASRIRADTFDLTADRPAGVDDIDEYLAATTSLRRGSRTMIAAQARGSYVYASIATRLSWGVGRARHHELPPDLDGLYRLWLDRLGLTEFGQGVLSLLACSRDNGFTRHQIAPLMGVPVSEVGAALSRCRQLLDGNRHMRPHHRCLREHLRRTHERGAGAQADWIIATDLLNRWDGRWQSCSRPYGLRNLLVHLADVWAEDDLRRDAARDALVRTVSDPRFLARVVTRVGVEDLLTAVRYARRRLATRLELLDDVAEVLIAQAATLRLARSASDAELAIQQLVFQAAVVGAGTLGRALASGVGGRILTLWATVDSPFRFAPSARPGHSDQVASIAIIATGEKGITTAADGATKVWWLASGRLAHRLVTEATVTSLVPVPGGSHILTAGADGRAEVWDIGSGEAVGRMTGGRTVTVTAFAVSADLAVGVTGDVDGNATVWDLRIGEPVVRLPCRSSILSAMAVSADGCTAATGTTRGTITMWNTATGKPICVLDVGTRVSALALTLDGRRVIVGSDRNLTVHEVDVAGTAIAVASLWTRRRVTAIAVNPAIPSYVLFGTSSGQVGYVCLPA